MLLGGIFFIVLCVNIWFGWLLGTWIGIAAVFLLLPLVAFLTLGGGIALGLIGLLFGKRDGSQPWGRFFRSFFRGWAWIAIIVWVLPVSTLGIMYGLNAFFPATLPRITISNGEKIVIFQSMMHIASEKFYEDVQKDMEHLRDKEYVFFFEGVRPGTTENTEELGRYLGMNIDEDMYLLFADIAGLVLQETDAFMNILPGTNIDLSTDEIMQMAKQNDIPPSEAGEDQQQFLARIEAEYPRLQHNQKTLLKIMSQGILNAILRSYTKPSLTTSLKTNYPIFTIILDARNTLLAETIHNSPNQHIYIHYGALHYPGMLAELQKRDPRWKEIARTQFQVIR